MPRRYSELYIAVRNALRSAGVEAANVEARLMVAAAAGKTTAQLLRDMSLYDTDEVDFEKMSYPDFLEQRRKLMAGIVKKAYQKLCE